MLKKLVLSAAVAVGLSAGVAAPADALLVSDRWITYFCGHPSGHADLSCDFGGGHISCQRVTNRSWDCTFYPD